MNNTRPLFASIGVSVVLVAAAALSLFAVSLVIAFGGWSAGMGESEVPATLVIAAPTTAKEASTRRHAAPIVLRAPAQAPQHRATPPRARVVPEPVRPPAAPVVRRRSAATAPAVAPAPVAPTPVATPPAENKGSSAGEPVRRLGNGLSSTAQNTGKALGEVTAPLSPPVSSATQKVVNLAAEAVQRTTNGLGGTLDKLGQKR
jgi:hypothetical protein